MSVSGPARRLDHAAIESDWFNRSLSRLRVAAKHGTTSDVINNIWKRARAAGRLPELNRLVWFQENSPEAYIIDDAAEAAFARELARDDDDAVCADIPADPLLARLNVVHGRDPRRGHDEVTRDDATRVPSLALVDALLRQHDIRQYGTSAQHYGRRPIAARAAQVMA